MAGSEPALLSSCRNSITGEWDKNTGALRQEKRKMALRCVQLFGYHELEPARFLRPWDSPGKNTGGGLTFPSPEELLTQELNPGLLHCRLMLYQLSYAGSI